MLPHPKQAVKMVCLLLGFAALKLNAATEIPEGGISILPPDPIASHTFWAGNNHGPVGSREIVAVEHPDFDKAIRATITNPNGAFWNGQISIASTQGVSENDVLLIRVFFRSIYTEDETGTSFTTVYPQSPAPDFTKYLTRELAEFKAAGWVEYLLPFKLTESLSAGDLTLLFGLGAGVHPQQWEIGGIELINYKQTKTLDELPQTKPSYLGREPDAPWRKQAEERIERYRKGPLRIHIFDANGTPVPNAEVALTFKKHAYHFGSAISASRLLSQDVNGEIYRSKVLELFNQAGPENALKWGAWDGEWGSLDFGREIALEALGWLKEHDLFTRGHVMVWPSKRNLPNSMQDFLPDGDPANADPAAKQAVIDHIVDIGVATAPNIDEWDVINEPFDNHYLMDAFGDDIMVDWFTKAREVLPHQTLYLNDYGILSGGGRNADHQQHFEDTIRFLLDNNAPMGAIGMQGHFSSSPTSIDTLWEVLERYSTQFPDLKIRITEFTVATDDEEMQGDYLRDFFTQIFSHPKTIGIQLWGFWENQIFNTSSAIYRADWSPKPAALAYQDLVLDKWWNNFSGVGSEKGTFGRRSFYGEYEATVNLDGIESKQAFSILEGSDKNVLIFLSNVQSGTPPIINGNFETQDLNGWDVNSSDAYEYGPQIFDRGTVLPFFNLEPSVGNAALTFGFKGDESGEIELSQSIHVGESRNQTLSFDYRVASKLLNTNRGTPLDLHIEYENGDPAIITRAIFHPETGSDFADTGLKRMRLNLDQFSGKTLKIRFTLNSQGTGGGNYTYVMLDNVTVAPFSLPKTQLTLDESNQVSIEVSSDEPTIFKLEKSDDLTDWKPAAEFTDLDIEGPKHYHSTSPVDRKVFYRLSEK